jgi:hypothetical protein
LLVPAAFLKHRGPVQPDHDLVAQNLEQLKIVLAEGTAVMTIVRAHRADHDAGGAERNHGNGAKRDGDIWRLVAPGIGVHVVRDQCRPMGYHPPEERLVDRDQPARHHLERPRSRGHPQESTLLHHKGDSPTLGLEQVGRGMGYLVDEAGKLGPRKHGRREVAEPLELAVAGGCRTQCLAQGLATRPRESVAPAQGGEGEERRDHRECEPEPMCLKGEIDAEPSHDNGHAGEHPGHVQPAPLNAPDSREASGAHSA